MSEPLGGIPDQVALLFKETSRLEQQLTQLAGEYSKTRKQLGGLEELQKELAGLKKAVEALTQEAEAGTLWDWAAMDQQEALEAWEQLREWVETVLDEQLQLVALPDAGTNVVPPCWYLHRDVVWELSWLCQEWLNLYRGDGTARQAGDWWDRWLPGVLRRIGESPAGKRCKTSHSDPGPAPKGRPPQPSWDDVVQTDIAERPEPPKKDEQETPE